MDLILWRHAEAEDGIPDMARPLSAKGVKQAHKMAAFLRKNLPAGTRILASPARRAQETAGALTHEFDTVPAIAPGCNARAVLDAAGWPHGNGAVLMAGHQPALGEAAAMIMAGKPEPWSIKKGAIWWFCARDGDDPILRLVLSPDYL